MMKEQSKTLAIVCVSLILVFCGTGVSLYLLQIGYSNNTPHQSSPDIDSIGVNIMLSYDVIQGIDFKNATYNMTKLGYNVTTHLNKTVQWADFYISGITRGMNVDIYAWTERGGRFGKLRGIYSPVDNWTHQFSKNLDETKTYIRDKIDKVAMACGVVLVWDNAQWVINYKD